MFNHEELITKFTNIGTNYNQLVQWFGQLNGKCGQSNITDDDKYELVEFWDYLNSIIDNDSLEKLSDTVLNKVWHLVKDFLPTYRKMEFDKYNSKLNEKEQFEANLLYKNIWHRKQRADISGNYYDWDEDNEKEFQLYIPRENNRDDYKYDLKMLCSKVIYNRGACIIRFYTKRGMYELVGINASYEDGSWKCLSEQEVANCYEDGLLNNEKVIEFSKPNYIPKEIKKDYSVLNLSDYK